MPGGVISSVFASRVICVRMYLRASSVSAHPATYSGSMVTDGGVSSSAGAPDFGWYRCQSWPVGDRLQECDVTLRDRLPVALALDPSSGASVPISAGDPAGRRGDSGTRYSVSSSVSSTGTLRQTSSGYSANDPISDTSTARAETQGPQQGTRTFAHGRESQVQNDVARGYVSDKVFDRSEAQDAHGRVQPESVDERLQRKIGMRLAYQDHPGVWLHPQETPECAERLRDALVRLEKSKHADERGIEIDPEPLAISETGPLRESTRRVESRRQVPSNPAFRTSRST